MKTIEGEVSENERDFLVRLARNKSAAGRRILLAVMGDLFFARADVLSDRERALMTEILHQLIHDAEISIRRVLAERLALLPDAPPELIVTLANDEIEVAHPILVNSDVLQDCDLIEIIRNRTLEHQLAVALRKSVSESVSDALVATGSVDVIRTLIENHGARISDKTMEYLVDQSQRVDSYQEPLLRRQDLPQALVERMYWWVGAALRSYILNHFAIDPTALDQALETSVHVLSDQPEPRPALKSELLADEIADAGPITPKLMLQILRQGEVPLFTSLFARFTGLRSALVTRMLFEPGGEGLCIACRGGGIDKSTFASLYALSRKVHGEAPHDLGQMADILKLYDRLTVDSAKAMLKTWQRNPNFLRALWELDHGVLEGAGVPAE